MLVVEKKKTAVRRLTFAGFFDLQVNGFAGVDLNDPQLTPDDILRMVAAMRATGVTRMLPTLITSATSHFAKCASVIASVNHPAIAGIHMEGPYISRFDGPRGAHPLKHVAAASIDDFKYRQEAAPLARLEKLSGRSTSWLTCEPGRRMEIQFLKDWLRRNE